MLCCHRPYTRRCALRARAKGSLEVGPTFTSLGNVNVPWGAVGRRRGLSLTEKLFGISHILILRLTKKLN